MEDDKIKELIEQAKTAGRLEIDNYYRTRINDLLRRILSWTDYKGYSEGEINVMKCIASELIDIGKHEDLGDYPGVIENQFDNMTGSMNL